MQSTFTSLFKNKLHSYIVLAVIFLASLLFYYQFMYDCDCSDLGLKIGAARLQSQGQDAYFFTNADGTKVINGVTSTPFLHTMLTPLINANACTIKQASFWMNFTLLFLCFILLGWLFEKTHWLRLYIMAAIVVLVFVFSRPFYANLRFGQVYVLYVLLVFVLLYLLQKKQLLLLGIVWALAIAFRPIFLAGGILALLYFNKKVFTGLAIGAVIFIAITVATGTFSNWKQYSAAMKNYSQEVPYFMGASKINPPKHVIADIYTYGSCNITLTPRQAKEKVMVLRTGTFFPTLQQWLINAHILITNVTFYSITAMLASLIFAFGIKWRLKEISPEKFVLTLFILYIICEICVPAARIRYSTILWLFGVGLIIARGNFIEAGLMVIGMYFFFNYHHHPFNFAEVFLLTPCVMFLLRKSETPYYIQWFIRLKQRTPFIKYIKPIEDALFAPKKANSN